MVKVFQEVAKEDLIKNELFRILFETQIDSLYRIYMMAKGGYSPDIHSEDAKGELNKGSFFIPGGFIPSTLINHEENQERFFVKSGFRKLIFESMQKDGATLVYPRKIINHFSIPSTYWDIAKTILNLAQVRGRKRRKIKESVFQNYSKYDVTRSNVPSYIDKGDYGTRLVISACTAMTLIDPHRYLILSEKFLNLDYKRREELEKNIILSQEKIYDSKGELLIPPYIFNAGVTRHHERNITAPIIIMGYGEFGEFATFSLEKITKDLLVACEITESDDFVLSNYDEKQVGGVFRMYPPTSFGKRRRTSIKTHLISPANIGMHNEDLERITYEAMERYHLR